MSPCSFLIATFAKESVLRTFPRKKMNMVIWEFRSKQALFSKWLPGPNHYAHWIRIEILSRTPVSILLYLSPRPQNLRKTLNNSFLA